MLKKYIALSALAVSFLAVGAPLDPKINEGISSKLSTFDISVEAIQLTPIADIYEVRTNSGILYTNKDASYFFYGKMFETKEGQLIDLTEKAQAKINLDLYKKADVEKELIVYPAKNEKHKITVFTDTSCGYCRKLHSEMQGYNDLGITVQYLAFPRAGERSQNLGQMSAIWCAKDQKKAMDLAKTNSFTETDTKCLDTMRKHYMLGQQMAVSGTPAIMLEDGTLVSGYVPPAQLLQRIEQKG